MDRAVRLIVNPSAGAGRAARALPAVEAALRSHGVSFRVDRTTSIDHARALAREASGAGEIAAAMGGDGLTGAVAGELKDTDAVMAVLPGGRGNDLARKLGIGADPVAAVDVLVAGRERRIDVAEAGGGSYLGILSAGLDSDVQDIANDTRVRRLGPLVYTYGALVALSRWHPAQWDVTIDGDRAQLPRLLGGGVELGGLRRRDVAGPGRVARGWPPGRRVITADQSRLAYLRGLPKVFKGEHVDSPGFEIRRGREVTFAADRPFTAYADGDPIADLPVTVSVAPGALRVIAP